MRRFLIGAVLTFALVGCGDDSGDDDSDDDDTADGAVRDGGADGGDAGRSDGGMDGGGGTIDSGVDAARPDATTPSDASTDAARSDASATTDAGGLDASAGGDAGGGDAGGGDAGAETFSALYTSIFQPTCAGCHTGTHRTGLFFSSEQAAYDSLVGDPAGSGATGMGSACDNEATVPVRVVAGNAAASLLIDKLEPNPMCGNRMPPNAAPLSDAQIARIRSWINAGAAR